ncbi:hypothetical protein [Cronobacter dublinensis]|uniref:hypothetical protein n=1 Tax=Cronobacter dublinensis TaxID=413497 RepID=UPI001F491779|nr:hypothetical protein [Cronobacter dublinensis]
MNQTRDDHTTPKPTPIHFGTHNVYYVKLHLMPEPGYLAMFVRSYYDLPCNAHSQNPSSPRIMPLRYAKSGWLSLTRFLRIHVAHRVSYRLTASGVSPPTTVPALWLPRCHIRKFRQLRVKPCGFLHKRRMSETCLQCRLPGSQSIPQVRQTIG